MELASMPLLVELFNATSERSPFGHVPVRLNSQTGSTGLFSSNPLNEKSEVSFPALLGELSEVVINSGTQGTPPSSRHLHSETLTPETSSTQVPVPYDAVPSDVSPSDRVSEDSAANQIVDHDVPIFDRAASLLSQRQTSVRPFDVLEERSLTSATDQISAQALTDELAPCSLESLQSDGEQPVSAQPASKPKEKVRFETDATAEGTAIAASPLIELTNPAQVDDLQQSHVVSNESAGSDQRGERSVSNVISTSATLPDTALRSSPLRTAEESGRTAVSSKQFAQSHLVPPEPQVSLTDDASAFSTSDITKNVSEPIPSRDIEAIDSTTSMAATESATAPFDDREVIDQLEKLIAGERSRIESLRVLPDRITPLGSRGLETNGNFARNPAAQGGLRSSGRSEWATRHSNSTVPGSTFSQAPALRSAEVEVTSSQETVREGQSPMPREVPVASRYSRQQFFDNVATAQQRPVDELRTSAMSPEQSAESVTLEGSAEVSDRALPVDQNGVTRDVQASTDRLAVERLIQEEFLPEPNIQSVVFSNTPRPGPQRSRNETAVTESDPVAAEYRVVVRREDSTSRVDQTARENDPQRTPQIDLQPVPSVVERIDVNSGPAVSTASPLVTFPSVRKATDRSFGDGVVSELSSGRARQLVSPRDHQAGTTTPMATSSHEILAGSPAQAVNQMVRVIMAESPSLAHVDNHRFEIRISDPDLGSVSIEIRRSTTADGMEIRVTADSAETHLLLEQQADEMTRSLQEQGVNLTQFDLSHEGKDSGNSPDQVVELFEEFEKAQLIQESKQAFETAPVERRPIRDGISFRA